MNRRGGCLTLFSHKSEGVSKFKFAPWDRRRPESFVFELGELAELLARGVLKLCKEEESAKESER